MSKSLIQSIDNGELTRQLAQHELRIQYPGAAQRIYRDFLTDEERLQLGTLEEAYSMRSGFTVGMWMKAKGVSQYRAIIEVSRCFGLPEAEYENLLRQLGEQRVAISSPSRIPKWVKERHTLLLDGEAIKVLGRPKDSWKQIMILDAFQEEGWPNRIYDPLPPPPNDVNSRQLIEVVRSLKNNLQRITFQCDGTSEGICWEFITASSPESND